MLQAPFHTEFTSFGTETLARGDTIYFWKRRDGNPFGTAALQHPTRAHVVAAAPRRAWQHCPCSGTPQALSPPQKILAEPTPALTFLAPSSMGARHLGVSLRTLLTKVDTGWKTMFSVGWMSLTASWVGTSAKSSHFLMASSPSRMAGILGTRRGPRGHGAAELSPAEGCLKAAPGPAVRLTCLWWMKLRSLEASTVMMV